MLTGTLPGLRGSFCLRLASILNHRPAYRQPSNIILHSTGKSKRFFNHILRHCPIFLLFPPRRPSTDPASAMNHTSAAPAARSARAQARAVAPVVSTSSTNSRRRPRTSADAAKAPSRLRRRAAPVSRACWAVPECAEAPQPPAHPTARPARAGQDRGLVDAPHPKARRVHRHRHHRVHGPGGQLPPDRLLHRPAHPVRHAGDAPVLHAADHAAHRAAVGVRKAGGGEHPPGQSPQVRQARGPRPAARGRPQRGQWRPGKIGHRPHKPRAVAHSHSRPPRGASEAHAVGAGGVERLEHQRQGQLRQPITDPPTAPAAAPPARCNASKPAGSPPSCALRPPAPPPPPGALHG